MTNIHRTRHIPQISKIQHIPLPQKSNSTNSQKNKKKKNKWAIIEHIK